ncbi:hypothetical protein PTKIN_Ptkin16aG0023800 [Pterospermum kingtungense]
MQRHILLVAVVLASLSLLVSCTSPYPKFFYKLSLQLPPSVCSISECTKPDLSTFTIHGLWPQFDDKPVPPYGQKCNKTPTKTEELPDKLLPIKDQLEQHWPNLLKGKGKTDMTFWQHEWEYHGMCSDYPRAPKTYFEAALDLFDDNNPGKVLKPRDKSYKGKDIRETIHGELKKNPEISCLSTKDGNLLKEIRLCFERDNENPPSFHLKDCPKKYSGTCTSDEDNIKVPPRPVKMIVQSDDGQHILQSKLSEFNLGEFYI